MSPRHHFVGGSLGTGTLAGPGPRTLKGRPPAQELSLTPDGARRNSAKGGAEGGRPGPADGITSWLGSGSSLSSAASLPTPRGSEGGRSGRADQAARQAAFMADLAGVLLLDAPGAQSSPLAWAQVPPSGVAREAQLGAGLGNLSERLPRTLIVRVCCLQATGAAVQPAP